MRVKAIFPAAHGIEQKEFHWEAPSNIDAEALEQTFREFNVVQEGDSHIARECRSMSVGDVVILDEDGIYICAGMGWKLVCRQELDLWLSLPHERRMVGP